MGTRRLFHFYWQVAALLWYQLDGSIAQSTTCLEGFTQDLPPKDEWSRFSTRSISPDSEVVFTAVKFKCNGTLEALNVPIELRGSDYQFWDFRLIVDLTVWRQNKTHIAKIETVRIAETIDNRGLEMFDNITIMLNEAAVVQFIENVDVGIDIMEDDVMGVIVPRTRRSVNVSGTVDNTVAEHLPLLFQSDTQIPLISATFIPSTSPMTNETSTTTSSAEPQGTTQQPSRSIFIALTVVVALVLLLAAAVVAVIIVMAVKLRQRKSIMVRSTRYRSGPSLVQSENFDSVQPLIVYNTDSGAPDDDVPAEYTYAWSARKRMRLPTPPFPTTSVPPQVEEAPLVATDGISHVPSSAQRQSMETSSNDGEEYYTSVRHDSYSQPEASHLQSTSDSELYWDPGSSADAIFNQMSRAKYIEIPPSRVKKDTKLGEGQFGEVFKGEWTSPTKTLTVALKSLKSSASDEERLKLLQEAVIMGQFNHPHIVRLYGVVTLSKPVSAVMEFLPGGDLRSYLLNVKESKVLADLPEQLLRFCQEIADAMEYLSKKGFIHRDLAARNMLLTTDMKCKLADFGMSHDMDEEYYYKPKGGMIPVKWTAPEAILHNKYTTKSDVWSYGMVMYEIWSLGHKPFEEWDTFQVVRAFSDPGGYCQPPPPGCPRAVYAVMVQCWNPDYHSRVSFTEVVQSLNYDQRSLLTMDPRDKTGTPLSLTLGAPLEHGQELHKDLQDMYKM